jgi:FAD/FMN-containing dehydrogenase
LQTDSLLRSAASVASRYEAALPCEAATAARVSALAQLHDDVGAVAAARAGAAARPQSLPSWLLLVDTCMRCSGVDAARDALAQAFSRLGNTIGAEELWRRRVHLVMMEEPSEARTAAIAAAFAVRRGVACEVAVVCVVSVCDPRRWCWLPVFRPPVAPDS